MRNIKRYRIIKAWLNHWDLSENLTPEIKLIRDGKANLPACEPDKRCIWFLSPEDFAIYDWHTTKERSKRGYAIAGNSESQMRNRVERAKSFGLYHDGIYDSYKGKGR